MFPKTPCDPCTGQPTASHSVRRNHKRRHPPAIPGVGFATIGLGWKFELVRRSKWVHRSRGPGTKWRCVEIYTPHRMTPPRGSVQLPFSTPRIRWNSTPISGGMGYAQFAFSTGIRPFFHVSWNSSNSACFGCFFTQPRKHTFLHFFCQFQGSRETPRNVEFRPQFRGGTPAPYMFFIRSWTRFARPKKTRCESNF
jgi:hypothetical protein